MLLSGKTAVVTGASGGLGSAIARSLIENGAKIVALDMSLDKAEEAADALSDDEPPAPGGVTTWQS